MSTAVEYTLSEMILLAAEKLEEQGQSPFSAEELIVASWKQFPRSFGLKGYAEQYPDSNRVLSAIMGEKGLARRGWLAKMGAKLYSLTKEGKRAVSRLDETEEEIEEEPTVTHMPRDQEKLLVGLLDSSAADKVSEKRVYELTFADACRFWGITDNLSPDALEARLTRVENSLDNAERLASKNELHVGSRPITQTDVELLHDTHQHLMERFSRHLSLLRTRAK